MNEMTTEKRSAPVEDRESRFLIFTLAKEEFAIPLLSVKEVIAIPTITPVPDTQPHVLGLMNLRGQVIPVIDLGAKLNLKDVKRGPESAIVILDHETSSVGVVVSSVENVLALNADQISERPSIESNRGNDFLSGVAKREENLILMLNLEKLLRAPEIKSVAQQRYAA